MFVVAAEERHRPVEHVLHETGWQLPLEADAPGPPVKALDLIGEHYPRDDKPSRKRHLERVALDLIGDRTDEGKADLTVVACRGKNDRGTLPGLFMSGLGVEVEPDEITPVGAVARSSHR